MLRKILLLLAILVLLMPGVQAASDMYMVLGSEELSGCPCTNMDNTLMVTNTGDASDTFTFSLDLPGGWSGFIPPEKTLGIGETKNLNFYITPPCFIQAGDHQVKVKAKASDGREFSKNINIEVLTCHYVGIEADELRRTCKGFPADYEIKVTNFGKVRETFDVKVTSSWGEELMSISVGMASQVSETFDISVLPPDVGTHYITVTAKSQDSYAENEKEVQLNVENCYDLSLDIQPKENVVCLGGSGKYVLLIKNTGSEEDEYEIHAPDWVTLNQDSIKVPPKTERNVGLLAYPEMEGKNTFEIQVVSSEYSEAKGAVSGTANTIECKDVAVIVSPAEETVCQGLTTDFEVKVKNTGTVAESFEIQSDAGILEANRVSLEAGEIGKLKLTVDSSGMEFGTNYVTVTARSGEVSDQNVVSLLVEDCYSLEFEVSPEESEACEGDEVLYTMFLKNTGKFIGTYALMVDDELIGTLLLTPDESKVAETKLMAIKHTEEESHMLLFRAVSDQKTFETTSELAIKPKEECFSVDLSSEKVGELKMVGVGDGVSMAIRIKNSGEREDVYTLGITGPEWVYLSEEEISLGSGEEEDIYIYASPQYGVGDGVYTAKVSVISENAQNELNFMFGVGEVEGPTNETNVTITPGGPLTGMITAEGGETTGKVVLLALITVFIIVILALKLVLFVK
jgi:uncharacterized membrane protein